MDYHVPVLLQAAIDGLNIKPDGIYIDATFGGGGHAKAIVQQLTTGKLIAFDQDPDARRNIPDDNRVVFVASNFRYIRHFLKFFDIREVDGILADLGVSSHHFDTPERGFSFRFDADLPLDMRMNPHNELTAERIINFYDKKELYRIFSELSELENSRKITDVIVNRRENEMFKNIKDFSDFVKKFIPLAQQNKALAKIFQGLRMEVNQELEVLKDLLLSSSATIRKGGRLVVISYHSLEDRLVKNYIRSGTFDGQVEKDIYGNANTPFKAVHRDVIVPSEQEIEQNSRARSAKMRIAEKM